jgi:predicted nucleic-acid-binding protein
LTAAASLDTNILVRYIVRDDDRQTMAVAKVLEQHIRKSQNLWVPVTVVLELEWVLRSGYKFSKAHVIRAMSALKPGRHLARRGTVVGAEAGPHAYQARR